MSDTNNDNEKNLTDNSTPSTITTQSPEIVNVDTPNDNDIDIDSDKMELNESTVDKGTHFYGETVSSTVNATDMLDFIADIFVQYRQGKLPKISPEETAVLLAKWFDGSITEDDESKLYEQSVAAIESGAEQLVRHILKRPRIDSFF
jgi:hypothetical protein